MHLRYDYTNLKRLSPLAKRYETMQSNCSLKKVGLFNFINKAGLGSNLHVYSLGLCLALQMRNVRMRTHQHWVYRDVEACGNVSTSSSSLSPYTESPMQCYFPQAEPICPGDIDHNDATSTELLFDLHAMFSHLDEKNSTIVDRNSCRDIIKSRLGEHANIRASTTEYLFTRVSNVVQQEAERQLNILFGTTNMTTTRVGVPKNLITVHIRWGDKSFEMKLIAIEEYIKAINEILQQRQISTKRWSLTSFLFPNSKKEIGEGEINNDEDVHIYLSTEDPKAVAEFMKQKPKHWNVYLDQYYIASLPSRMEVGNVYNAHVKAAEKLQGKTGLIALGSLLVAMEANDFVLTTKSNWSRLMNEIRKNIIHPRCNQCTTMIDLQYGEF